MAQGADSSADRGPGAVEVVYFYSPTCLKCAKAKEVLDEAERHFDDRATVTRWNVHETAGLERMFACEDQFGAKGAAPPKVYVIPPGEGDVRCLVGLDAIEAELLASVRGSLPPLGTQLAVEPESPEPATRAETAASMPASGSRRDERGAERSRPAAGASATTARSSAVPVGRGLPVEPGRSRILERFGSFRAPAVAAAGLVDGLNPCAFATIVFMVSVLGALGRTKRQIAIVGGAFTVAVFLTYLLLGIGLLTVLRTFAVSRGVSLWLNGIVAGLAFLLAGWSAFDGVRALRRGDQAGSTLRLPKRLVRAIHWTIRKGLRTRNLLIGSFLVGCLVSLLESLCTGQVYLPTIMLVLRAPGHRLAALAYLVLYNLMFIMPLAAIMILAYHGMRWQKLSGFLRRHLATARFLMAGVFAGLGTLLVLLA